jgi:hypothetical protein
LIERWRRKLAGIDQVGPSDDVFERAKAGPSLPERQSPMQRTSTRVVTAIAAFVVFALGISVFAIPALRLGGNPTISAGGQVQPLWPWSSIDAVQAWRDDPQSIGSTSVDHFSSPNEVATAFGRDVLGWTEVWAHEQGTPETYPCPGPGPIPQPDVGFVSPSGAPQLCSSVVYPGMSMPPTMVPYAPTTAPPAFRTFDLSTCPPDAACDYAFGPPSASVVVFQPIGSGGPWAVLEARNNYVGLSLAPGTVLHDGSTIYASGLIPNQTHAVLGFHASSTGCGETGTTGGFGSTNQEAGTDLVGGSAGTYARGQLDLKLSGQDPSCQQQGGYAFVVISDEPVSTTDPLAGLPSGAGVFAFSAVPLTFTFPTVAASSAPPSLDTSTPPQMAWTTYTNDLGWTIDVPRTWDTTKLDGSDANGDYDGAAFGSAPLEQYPGGPTTVGAPSGEVLLILYQYVCTACLGGGSQTAGDDVQFPLSIDDMDPVDGGSVLTFRMNGSPFILSIRAGGDGPTPEQTSILSRMVSSITFEP